MSPLAKEPFTPPSRRQLPKPVQHNPIRARRHPFYPSKHGLLTIELVIALNTWDKARRFVVSRVLKFEKDRKQLSFLESETYNYFFFVTNKTESLPKEVIKFYEKRGNCENYIKEAKYDMAVGHLLLLSFWANEAIFQIMRLTYNLFLLF